MVDFSQISEIQCENEQESESSRALDEISQSEGFTDKPKVSEIFQENCNKGNYLKSKSRIDKQLAQYTLMSNLQSPTNKAVQHMTTQKASMFVNFNHCYQSQKSLTQKRVVNIQKNTHLKKTLISNKPATPSINNLTSKPILTPLYLLSQRNSKIEKNGTPVNISLTARTDYEQMGQKQHTKQLQTFNFAKNNNAPHTLIPSKKSNSPRKTTRNNFFLFSDTRKRENNQDDQIVEKPNITKSVNTSRNLENLTTNGEKIEENGNDAQERNSNEVKSTDPIKDKVRTSLIIIKKNKSCDKFQQVIMAKIEQERKKKCEDQSIQKPPLQIKKRNYQNKTVLHSPKNSNQNGDKKPTGFKSQTSSFNRSSAINSSPKINITQLKTPNSHSRMNSKETTGTKSTSITFKEAIKDAFLNKPVKTPMDQTRLVVSKKVLCKKVDLVIKEHGHDVIKVGGSVNRMEQKTSSKCATMTGQKFNIKPSLTPKAIKIENFRKIKESEAKTNNATARVSIDREMNNPPQLQTVEQERKQVKTIINSPKMITVNLNESVHSESPIKPMVVSLGDSEYMDSQQDPKLAKLFEAFKNVFSQCSDESECEVSRQEKNGKDTKEGKYSEARMKYSVNPNEGSNDSENTDEILSL